MSSEGKGCCSGGGSCKSSEKKKDELHSSVSIISDQHQHRHKHEHQHKHKHDQQHRHEQAEAEKMTSAGKGCCSDGKSCGKNNREPVIGKDMQPQKKSCCSRDKSCKSKNKDESTITHNKSDNKMIPKKKNWRSDGKSSKANAKDEPFVANETQDHHKKSCCDQSDCIDKRFGCSSSKDITAKSCCPSSRNDSCYSSKKEKCSGKKKASNQESSHTHRTKTTSYCDDSRNYHTETSPSGSQDSEKKAEESHHHDHNRKHDSSHSHTHDHHSAILTCNTHHERKKPPTQAHGRPNCVAILREDGDVDVYDKSGQVKTFTIDESSSSKSLAGSHLCFQTHGHGDIDKFLTPCFDEDGLHGNPEEDCYCGVDGPHLHAHLQSDKMCRHDLHSNQKFQMASVILKPKAVMIQESPMPVSESLPNSCNSLDFVQSMSEHGLDTYKFDASKAQFFKVQHENHVDMLMYNQDTGKITLEYDCEGCGKYDIHGTLDYCAQRKFETESDTIQMNFYEIPRSPLCLLDLFSDYFAIEDDKAHVMRHTFPKACADTCCKDGACTADSMNEEIELPSARSVVRSTIHVKGICCAADIPMIDSTIKLLDGVSEWSVNTTTKLLNVNHDPEVISVNQIVQILNKEKFDASVRKDGSAATREISIVTSGRSSFFVSGICCSSEIPAINSILEPLDGVKKISINVPNKTVYVEHDFALITAVSIKNALDKQQFDSRIEQDAQAKATVAAYTGKAIMSKYVESTFLVTSFFTQTDGENVKSLLRRHYTKEHLSHSEIHVPSKTIKVDHNPQELSADALKSFLLNAGFDLSLIADGFAEGIWSAGDTDEVDEEHAYLQWQIILSGIFWIVSMLHFIGGDWERLNYAGILSAFLGIPKIASKALLTMRRKQFDTNCMMLFATVGKLCTELYLNKKITDNLAGALALQEYSEAAAVTFLFSISDWLESLSTVRARNALSAIIKLRPERAKVKDLVNGKFVSAPASSVVVGSIVSVRTGDRIPCDGIVIEGSSVVDESSLTGEPKPVRKVPGSEVSGGTVNAGIAQLLITTTSTVDNSAVARLIRLVEDAQANRSPTEKLIDEFAKRYTPLVVMLAFSMCTFPWIIGPEVGREWTKIGLVTIVIACPCALIISTPVTYVAGLAAAAQRGIVVKGGAHLESLGRVTCIAFDKTGTLTEGNFKLLSLRSWGEKTREEVLQLLYCIEGDASHPLAAAMLAAAKAEKVSVPDHWKIESHQNIEGEGVMAVINGVAIHVGNFRLFERLGYINQMPEAEMATAKDWLELGSTVGFLSVEGLGIVASYRVADAVREEARDVIAGFGKLGIDVNMLTGDNAKAANSIGTSLGLTFSQIKSQLLPHEKLDLVKELIAEEESKATKIFCIGKRPGLILMCGDGVNDAPALAIANVGVAMGAGAALAMETADVTLLDSNLEKLLQVLKLGKRATRTIIENVAFSFIAKAVVMGFAFAGYSNLWAAIGSDVGAMLIVTANGMKLLPSKKSVRTGDGFDSFKVRGNQSSAAPSPKREDDFAVDVDNDVKEYEC